MSGSYFYEWLFEAFEKRAPFLYFAFVVELVTAMEATVLFLLLDCSM